MMVTDRRPGYVYRAYAWNGALLYVGCTVDLSTRMTVHGGSYSKSWWQVCTSITVTEYGNREDAAEAEYLAICSERPLFNTVGTNAPGSQAAGEPGPPKVTFQNSSKTLDLSNLCSCNFGYEQPNPTCGVRRHRIEGSAHFPTGLAPARP